jgi:hypothetical protein
VFVCLASSCCQFRAVKTLYVFGVQHQRDVSNLPRWLACLPGMWSDTLGQQGLTPSCDLLGRCNANGVGGRCVVGCRSLYRGMSSLVSKV